MHLWWWLWMLLKESVVQNWQGWWIAESGFWFDWWQACAENRHPTTYAGHRWSWFSPWWWRRLDKVHWHRYHDGHGHDNVQDISIQFHAIFWENLAFSEDSKAAKPHLMMRWFAAVSDPAEGGERIIVAQDFGCKHPGVNFWNGRIAVSSVMKTMCIQ